VWTAVKHSEPGCSDRSKASLVPRMSPLRRPLRTNGAPAEDPAAFNAHSSGTSGSGLVQSVFSSPARTQSRCQPADACAPRRQAKNALHYVALWHATLSVSKVNCSELPEWTAVSACRLISAVGADFLPPSCNALRLALACCRFLRPTLAALQRTVAGQTIRSRCCSGGSSGVLPRSTHAPVGANTRTACRSRSTSD